MKIVFWCFLLVMLSLLPGVMLFFGNEFLRRPGAINGGYGYRTKRSMASQEAWDFAHHTCGKLWKKLGRWMLPLSFLAMLPALGFSVEGMGIWCLGLMGIQLVVMLGTIVPVERALKQNFD